MRHIHSIDRPICELDTPVDAIGGAVRSIYHEVECSDCLRRVIAEAEERARVLRELLLQVENAS